jgi:glycosyltransferase involved in cell wall biosynthesis
MKVSIITVCLNSKSSILKTIESVNSQSYSHIEHIFVDGESTDDTLSIVKNNSRKNSIIICEPDHSLYEAINKGLIASTGDIVGLLHADDIFATNDTISSVVNAFSQAFNSATNRLLGVYGDCIYQSKKKGNTQIRYWRSQQFKFNNIKLGWMPPHPTLFLSKVAAIRNGNYNLRYNIASDYDFILRLMLDPEISLFYLPEVITIMNTGGVSNKSLQNVITKSREDYKILSSHNIEYPLLALIAKNMFKIPQFFRHSDKH